MTESRAEINWLLRIGAISEEEAYRKRCASDLKNMFGD